MAVKTFELVSYEKNNRIAWVTINNESRMNALSTGVNNGLYDAFEEVDHDERRPGGRADRGRRPGVLRRSADLGGDDRTGPEHRRPG